MKLFKNQHSVPRTVLSICWLQEWSQGFCWAVSTQEAFTPGASSSVATIPFCPLWYSYTIMGHTCGNTLICRMRETQTAGTQTLQKVRHLEIRWKQMCCLSHMHWVLIWQERKLTGLGSSNCVLVIFYYVQQITNYFTSEHVKCWSTNEEKNFWIVAKLPGVHCKIFPPSTWFSKIPMITVIKAPSVQNILFFLFDNMDIWCMTLSKKKEFTSK